MSEFAIATGSVIGGRFLVERAAGGGGMSTLFRCRDLDGPLPVALKILRFGNTSNRSVATQRFLREAELLEKLVHPGIVPYIAHGLNEDQRRFLAMQWLEGEDLGARLKREGLTLRETLTFLRSTAEALAVAHRQGIVHRDIKPGNLFLREDRVDQTVLLDFGIAGLISAEAELTRTGDIIGTPSYMSPEQANGQREIRATTDIFSLGCVLFECLIGNPPFAGDTLAALLTKILFQEAPRLRKFRPELPRELEALVARMLAKNPAERPQTAAELLDELRTFPLIPDLPRPGQTGSEQSNADFTQGDQELVSVIVATYAHSVELDLPTLDIHSGHKPQVDNTRLRDVLSSYSARFEILVDGSVVVTMTHAGNTSAIDQALQAVRCAQAIKGLWPTAYVVLATGRSTLSQHMPVGEAIDRAWRLLRDLQPNSANGDSSPGVLIDEVSAGLLDLRYELGRMNTGSFQLLRERSDLDPTRPLLGKPTTCVGRERELAVLEGVWNECCSESVARVVLVTAPSGTGKSRLRHELLRRLQARQESMQLLLGRGDLGSAGSPYGLLSQALRRLCEIADGEPLPVQQQKLRTRLGRNLPSEQSARAVVFLGELCGISWPDETSPQLRAARQDPRIMSSQITQAALDFLRSECQVQPVLIVLEDLHWSDALTVWLIDHVLRDFSGGSSAKSESFPLMVLALARPEVEEKFPRLWLQRQRQDIRLDGLSKKASERLVRQALGKKVSEQTLERIVEQASGNALYLEELIRALADGKGQTMPETVMAMLQARLMRLQPAARRTLRFASVFGQTFWRGGLSVDELDSLLQMLVDTELVEQRRESQVANEIEYTFRHALMREAAYSLLSEAERRAGHRAAAAYLTRVGENDPRVLAEHFELGEQQELAVPLFLRAAEQSYQRNDLEGALALSERGIACGAQGSELGNLLALRSFVFLWREEWKSAFSIGRQGLGLLPSGSAWWCRVLAQLFVIAANLNEASYMNEIVQLYSGVRYDAEVPRDHVVTGASLVTMFAVVGLRDLARTFLAGAEQSGAALREHDLIVKGHLATSHSWLLYFLEADPWLALQRSRAGTQSFREARDDRNAAVSGIGQALIQAELGDLSEAERVIRDCMQSAVRQDEKFIISMTRLYLTRIYGSTCELLTKDQLDQVTAFSQEFIEHDSRAAYAGSGHGCMAEILLMQNDLVGAEKAARQAVDILAPLGPFRIPAFTTLVNSLLRQGRAEQARVVARDGLAHLDSMGGHGYAEIGLRLAAAEAFYVNGETAVACRTLDNARQQLLVRADKILDPAVRERYLTQVPVNARVAALFAAWVPAGHSDSR